MDKLQKNPGQGHFKEDGKEMKRINSGLFMSWRNMKRPMPARARAQLGRERRPEKAVPKEAWGRTARRLGGGREKEQGLQGGEALG